MWGVVGNVVSGNNWGDQEAPNTAGIIVFADPAAAVPPGTTAPQNIGTTVAREHRRQPVLWSLVGGELSAGGVR